MDLVKCANVIKSKYKQSKAEANTAQNSLQKEITSLRDTTRTIQLKLRDIEVANDDYEKQARNTTSSLEDMESKYNVAIERGVMMEEEIKGSEQDREALRIDAQRLRDELSDLKIEAEIRQEKLRKAEAAIISCSRTGVKTYAGDSQRPSTQQSDHSPISTTTSSPTIATPPTKSASSIVSDTPTPPSPPASDHSVAPSATPNGPTQKAWLHTYQPTATPTLSNYSRPIRHAREPSSSLSSTLVSNDRPTAYPRRTTINRRSQPSAAPRLPHSQSLHTVRGLMGKMASLQERVNSARSKLPAPATSSPHSSPRNGSGMGQAYIPPTITMRSNKKRTSGTNVNGSIRSTIDRQSTSRPASRLSFGFSQPSASPEKTNLNNNATPNSRPTSRHSISSRTSISHLPSAASASASVSHTSSRPSSRQSLTGSQTPQITHQGYSTHLGATISESRRPRSSIGGSYATMHASHHGHGHSTSVNRLTIQNSSLFNRTDEDEETSEVVTPTPARRTTMSRDDPNSGIPSLIPCSTQKRASGIGVSRRMSSNLGGLRHKENMDMGPPPLTPGQGRRPASRLSDTEETF